MQHFLHGGLVVLHTRAHEQKLVSICSEYVAAIVEGSILTKHSCMIALEALSRMVQVNRHCEQMGSVKSWWVTY